MLAMKIKSIPEPTNGDVIVYPEVAQTWLAQHNYEHQRAIRSYHVTTLTKEMMCDRFRQKTQINFCRLGDTYALTNGQHTLSAIVASGRPQLLNVVVLDVESAQQIADDFSRHDTHLTRQLSTSLVAHEMDKYFGVTRTALDKMSAATLFYSYMVGDSPARATAQISHDEKLVTLKKYGELARSVINIAPISVKGMKSFAARKTTLAPMMVVYNYSPSICEEFYGGMFLDDGLKKGDARKALLNFFRETRTTGGGSGTLKSDKKAHPDHMLVKAQAIAFNAFVSRKDIIYLRPLAEDKTVEFKNIGVFSC